MSAIGPARTALTAMRRIFETEGDGGRLLTMFARIAEA
jgi:hypothetical protein